MSDKSEKQVKSGRVSKNQRRRLLELMKQHRHIGKGQFLKRDFKKEHNAVWDAVAMELNAMGGSLKRANQWKKSWIDWKSSVKQQYGRHRAFSNRTGNLPSSEGPKAIDGLDKEVLEFFSKDVVDGDGHTPEGGFEPIVQIDLEDKDENEENVEWLDYSQIEAEEHDVAQERRKSPAPKTPAKSRGPTSQSCLEDVKKVCDENQAQIMEALNKIIALIDCQNATLVQMLHSMNRTN